MALSADAILPIAEGEYADLPVYASAVIYEGSVVSLTAAGYAKAYAGTDTIFAGIADRGVTGGTSSGDQKVRVRTDIHRRELYLSGAAAGDVGDPLYASDDGTFTKTAGSNLYVGVIECYLRTGYVLVRLEPFRFPAGTIPTAALASGAATLPKVTFTGLKLLAADGVNSTSADQEVTLTGSAVGDRVVAIFGHVKANTGAHSFLIPTIGTHFEATISVVNKIVQKQAAGDLSLNTYLFILAPAAA